MGSKSWGRHWRLTHLGVCGSRIGSPRIAFSMSINPLRNATTFRGSQGGSFVSQKGNSGC